MNTILKRVITIICGLVLTVSLFVVDGKIVKASENTINLIITEVYINDISRPQWIPSGATTFDPMEYIEIYNPTDSPVNFSQDYSLYHYRNTKGTEYSLPLYDQTTDIIIPAHGCIVLWGFYADKYANATADEIPSTSDFRDAFAIDESVGIYQVDTTSCKGFYNTYNGSFRIKDQSGNLICEAAYTPATDSDDGKSIEFKITSEGINMLIYTQMATPTPGEVSEEQYYTEPEANTAALIITEAYINDISRPEWVPSEVSNFDPMEYVEIYNPTDAPVNFSQDYSLYHFRQSTNKEYALPLYEQTDDVIIPANSSIVLWGFLASRYTSASVDEIPKISDFRSAFGIDDSVGIYMVDTSSCIGFYNTYNGSFQIKDNSGNLIYEAAYTPATDSADGKSIEFRMPAEDTTMLVYTQKADPSPGIVYEAQYTPPPIPNQPVISNITSKMVYSNEEEFTVSAEITDAQSTSLFIKQSNETGYQQMPMENNGDRVFSISVPRTKLWGETLKWYIEAYNDTKTTKSEDKESSIEYSYDSEKQPQVLMTELKTEDTDYNYLEFYNNSDNTINFVYFNVFYEYPSGLSYKRWTFDTNALYIESGKTLVVWINDDDKTVEQFNQHYGVNLEENKSIIKVDYSGMSPNVERTIKIGNTYDNPLVVATYHEGEIDDTAKIASIHYTFSRDNGSRMVKADTESAPTPGTIEAWQVPSERVPFDNYGGFTDDESTMVLRARDEVPQTIKEGEALEVDFDCYDTATGVNTIETYYKFDDEEQYRVKMEKTQRIANQFITSIPASEFLGHQKVTFYIRAYNAFRYCDTEVYEVSIKPSIDTEGITFNVKDNQIVSGITNITAIDGSGNSDISIEIDGQEQSSIPMLQNGAYFSYKSDNLTSYYKNAITVEDDVIKLLSSWAGVNQQAAHIDSRHFVRNVDGDYEVTVTLRAGTQGSPFEETEEHASFTMSHMALYLPDDTFIYPDNGIDYDTVYTIGDSSIALDVHFTIPKEKLEAKGINLNTTLLPDGEHVVRALAGISSKNVVVVVDNNAPDLDFNIENGQALESGDVISMSVDDEGSGIDTTKTEVILDEKKISLPYTVFHSNLENGTHSLYASYTDKAGHTREKSLVFTTDITVPHTVIHEVEQKKSESVTVAAQVYGAENGNVAIEFMEGKQFSIRQNNIQVSSGSGDDPLLENGTDSLIASSVKELPYQLFQVKTGNLDDEDLIEVDWQGSCDANGELQLFVLNVAEDKWESVAYADQGQIKTSFKAKNHIQNGMAMLLVQSRSVGNYPSVRNSGVLVDTATGSMDEWDGTDVPDNYDFSFAWITDPQYYVESWPNHYTKMNRWILDNWDEYNIKYTINTGDLVDEWDRDEQWQIADEAQKLLDDANMPNGVLAGNHDVASGNEEFDSYWKYFGEQRYKDNSYYGGSYRNNLGHYDLISAGGQDFIILYMSWDVYQPEVDWMNQILAQYPERKAIIAMHRYLKQGGTLDYAGQLVQNEVVAQNPNVFAVLNGHYFGAAIKVEGFDDDNDGIKERKVYQICTDYQGAVEGGQQYLKMIYFDLENNKIYMNAYSPYLNDFNYFDNPKLDSYDIGVTASSQDIYELDVRFDTALKTLETTDVCVNVYTNNSIGKQENVSEQVTQVWKNLTPGTQYWWYANVITGQGDMIRTPITSVQTLDNDIVIPAPSITSVIPGDAHVAISWNLVDEASGYKIFSSTTSGSYGTAMDTVSESVYGYDAKGLTNGTQYYFVLRTVKDGEESENSEEVSAIPQVSAPDAPQIQSVTAGDGQVRITWDPVEDSTGYRIFASTASGSYGDPSETVADSVYSCNVSNLLNGTRYYFVVTATNTGGESGFSNEVSTTPKSSLAIPDAPRGIQAIGGNGMIFLTWDDVPGAAGYKIYQSSVSGVYGSEIASTNSSTCSYEVTGLANGQTYYFVIKAFNNSGDSLKSDEVNAIPKIVPSVPVNVKATAGDRKAIVRFTAPDDDGGSPITGYIVTSYPGGITATGNSSPITVIGLNNGTTYTFTVKAVNSIGSSAESTVSNSVKPHSSSSSSSSSRKKTTDSKENEVEILVNGKTQTAAMMVSEKVDDKTVTTVTLDDKKLEEEFEKAGNNTVVTIPVNNDSDVVVGQLNGQTVKYMESKGAVLEIKTKDVIYTLPASQINIDDVSEELRNKIKLKDIAVKVKISTPSEETIKVMEDTANKNSYQIVVKPVEFEITCTSENDIVEISKFKGYVQRMIAIPDVVNPSKITTGIVLNDDGTFSHVPTIITAVDGKYYAKINSLTNSTYSVVYSSKTFTDVENHWAKEEVNDMGSRLVISGVGGDRFEPDRDITRAEFAAIVVRGLGLMRSGTGKDIFNDVTKDKWYYDAVSTAYEYGIINGYENEKFGPMDKITREQAMAITARAMTITGLKEDFKEGKAEKLLAAFSDSEKAADWARDSIAGCIKTGIVSGRSGKLIAPKENITRAEVAAIIRRLLRKSDLI